jgi:L-threonylcarbamoyladenylate synthase
LIVDAGPTRHGIESTIVGVSQGVARLLRPGPLGEAELGITLSAPSVGAIEAPGQMRSHYAPAKPLRLEAIAPEPGEWMIGFGAVPGDSNLSASGDLVEAAATLFDRLHEAETRHCAAIAVAPVPHEGLGLAINDRLARAAAPRRDDLDDEPTGSG